MAYVDIVNRPTHNLLPDMHVGLLYYLTRLSCYNYIRNVCHVRLAINAGMPVELASRVHARILLQTMNN